MNPAALIAGARKDGVQLIYALPDTVKLKGNRLAVQRWLPLVRGNKAEVVAALEAEALSKPTASIDQDSAETGHTSSAPEARKTYLASVVDERRFCTQCMNLLPSGQCQAAARGELNALPTYEPVQDILQRCGGYLPGPDDPDQRTGRERRWPT